MVMPSLRADVRLSSSSLGADRGASPISFSSVGGCRAAQSMEDRPNQSSCNRSAPKDNRNSTSSVCPAAAAACRADDPA
ncbi:hypothetical protein BDV33DRAFT_163583 [Aspergillus novoparasiticus]|uniref:Uncharacterized protein n=1 Tax=Aspergillus novoparasiticus TaxID=986946 RepID=A0A5N6F6G8_9EURO|nr:hypothetical protein BDV33DRAFT_163583 [Aspergillus novoparasiticus]